MVIRFTCIAMLACAAGCADLSAPDRAGIDGECGNVHHWCNDGLLCVNKTCVRDGGGIVGDKCSTKAPCASEFKCDVEMNICRDPCATVTCGDYGTCMATNGVALCTCEPGFANEQQRCVGTSGQVCGDTTQPCQTGLVCSAGRCTEPCGDRVCTGGMTCDTTQEPPVCSCPSGMRFDNGASQCINACTDETCSGQGTCSTVTGVATCTCKTGFVASGLSCVPKGCEPTGTTTPKCADDGNVHAFDSCGARGGIVDNCGARGCTANGCNPITWTRRDVTFDGIKFDNVSNPVDFVIRSDGTLVVATAAATEVGNTTVLKSIVAFRQSGGGSWIQPADISIAMLFAYGVKLALGPGDRLAAVYNAFDYPTSKNSIRYIEWDGGAWVGKGPSATSITVLGYSRSPMPALDSHGMPAVVYLLSYSYFAALDLLRWQGVTWDPVGESGTANGILQSGQTYSAPVVGFDDHDTLFVGWNRGTLIDLLKWDGSAWSPVTSATSSNITFPPGLAFGPGSMALAWAQTDGIHVVRWVNNVQLPETTVGSTVAGTEVSMPGVVFDGQGAPIVAWYESRLPSFAVYVRRWDANKGVWTELGAGSDSGTGLAGGYVGVEPLQLRINGSHLCVGWVPNTKVSTYALQCTTL